MPRYGIPRNESKLTCTSGAATFAVEFGVLSRLVGDPTFEVCSCCVVILKTVAKNAVDAVWNRRSSIGLLGNRIIFDLYARLWHFLLPFLAYFCDIDIVTGEWVYRDAGIGRAIDSFYEYLIKAAILLDDYHYYDIFLQVRRIFL